MVFYSPFGPREPKLVKKCPWKSSTRLPLVPDAKLQRSNRSSGMSKRRNFFGLNSFTAPSTFAFRLLFSLSASFVYLIPLFFYFVGHLVSFSSMGKVFTRSPRIMKIFWTRSRRVVEKNLYWNFPVKVTCFFFFRVSLYCLTEWR